MSFVKTRLKNVYEETTSGIYYVRIRRKGKRPFNKSLDTKNFKVAAQLADEKIREYLGQAPKKVEHRLFKDETAEFLTSYKGRVKPATFKRMNTVIKHHILPYWKNEILSEITPGKWDSYLADQKSKSNRDLSNDKKAMGNILSYAAGEGHIAGIPRLTAVKNESDAGREYSDEELARLLEVIEDDVIRLAVVLAYKSGPRLGEIVSIAWRDVYLAEKYIKVKGKTGIRKMAISDLVVNLLRSRKKSAPGEFVFAQERDPTKHISTNHFDNAWQPIKRLAELDGRFHDLRHTFITRALRAGKSIFWVSKQVGSSVRTITKVYEHLDIKDISELGETVSVQNERAILGVEIV